jgi:hypothetical protein
MNPSEKEAMRKAVVHWMDTMKERLDHYEVHRNEYLSDMRLPPRNVKFLREVLLPFCENTLLLDNITKSEGLCYGPDGLKNRLRIIVRVERNGKMEKVKISYDELVGINETNDISYPDTFPYLLKHRNFDKSPKENTLGVGLNGRVIKAGNSEYDFEICLPHEHAVYSILENVIRNSAKHNAGKFKPLNTTGAQGQPNGKDSGDQMLLDTLDIRVDLTDAGADHWHCTIYDNVSQVRYGPAAKGADRIADLTDMLERKGMPLLEDGKPNRANMGMADMKINAFLLQSAKDFSEDDLNRALDIVICDHCMDGGHEHTAVRLDKEKQVKKVVCENGKEVEQDEPEHGAYFFGYRFKLTKAKKVAWIGKGEEDEQRAALSHHGIRVFPTWGDYCTARNGSLAAYTFSVVDDLNWKEAWREFDASKEVDPLDRLGLRIMLNGEHNGHVAEYRVVRGSWRLPKPNEDCVRDFMEGLWANWVAEVFGVKEECPAQVYAYWDMAEVRTSWQSALAGLRGNLKVAVLDQSADRNGNGFITLAQHLDSRSVVLDHHGRAFNALACHLNPHNQDRIDETNWKEFMVKTGAYFFTDKSSSDHDAMVHVGRHGKDLSQWFAQLLDAWFTPVVVLDERIAERSGQTADGNAKVQGDINRGLYAAGNVFAVTDLQLLGSDKLTFPMVGTPLRLCLHFESEGKAQLLWSKPGAHAWNVLKDYPKPILLAHRTHLDQVLMVADEPALRKIFRDIFVTSGGGRPHGASKGFKFVPLGAWESYIGKSLSKLALMRVLSSLTR